MSATVPHNPFKAGTFASTLLWCFVVAAMIGVNVIGVFIQRSEAFVTATMLALGTVWVLFSAGVTWAFSRMEQENYADAERVRHLRQGFPLPERIGRRASSLLRGLIFLRTIPAGRREACRDAWVELEAATWEQRAGRIRAFGSAMTTWGCVFTLWGLLMSGKKLGGSLSQPGASVEAAITQLLPEIGVAAGSSLIGGIIGGLLLIHLSTILFDDIDKFKTHLKAMLTFSIFEDEEGLFPKEQ